jgi:hypothetical protein
VDSCPSDSDANFTAGVDEFDFLAWLASADSVDGETVAFDDVPKSQYVVCFTWSGAHNVRVTDVQVNQESIAVPPQVNGTFESGPVVYTLQARHDAGVRYTFQCGIHSQMKAIVELPAVSTPDPTTTTVEPTTTVTVEYTFTACLQFSNVTVAALEAAFNVSTATFVEECSQRRRLGTSNATSYTFTVSGLDLETATSFMTQTPAQLLEQSNVNGTLTVSNRRITPAPPTPAAPAPAPLTPAPPTPKSANKIWIPIVAGVAFVIVAATLLPVGNKEHTVSIQSQAKFLRAKIDAV